MCFTINQNIKTSDRTIGYKVVNISGDQMIARFASRYTPHAPTEYKLGVESRLEGLRKGKDTAYNFADAFMETEKGFYIFLTEKTARAHMRAGTALIKVSLKPKDFLHQSTPRPYGQATYRAITPVKILAKCSL